MKYRKLRIAWSIFWGVLCLLLVVLWMRSRHVDDRMTGPLSSSGFGLVSRDGGLGIGIWRREVDEGWTFQTYRPEKIDLPYTNLGFAEYMVDTDMYRVRSPYWFLTLISAAFATAPWIRHLEWRFSLRTLLKYQKLRVAWSVGWGVACLLLIVLWVRSYTCWDDIGGSVGGSTWLGLHSLEGRFLMSLAQDDTGAGFVSPWKWDTHYGAEITNEGVGSDDTALHLTQRSEAVGFGLARIGQFPILIVPHWAIALMVAAIASASWLPWRFSLRTLLIGTTLVAVVLGWIVYAIR